MFKVGDRVECVKAYNNKILEGMAGTVVIVDGGKPPFLIEWDDFEQKGHDGRNGVLPLNNGYWVYENNIDLLNTSLINE